MRLPVGIYAVSQSFELLDGTVSFCFQGVCYEAEKGINAFTYLEDLNSTAMQTPEQPFCGYSDVPVVILPAGLYKAGTIKESRFRTYLPCAMAILGENAGISPNGGDLRTPAPRSEETVIRGSFYFGCIAMRNGLDGTVTLDGLTLSTVKIFDERTQGQNLALEVKNCVFADALVYDLIRVFPTEAGCRRRTSVLNCRADGIGSHFGEGRFLGIDSGDLLVQRLYFANTDKFPGFTNYSHTIENRLEQVLFRDCLFENCGSVHGISIQLPVGSTAQLRLEGCEFINFAPEKSSAIRVNLQETAHLTLTGCRFSGGHSVSVIEIDGSTDSVTLAETVQQGYPRLLATKPTRRTETDSRPYPLTDPHTPLDAAPSEADAYVGTKPYYCDFHCHSNSGGTSDGKTPLENYVEGMNALGVDCAAIVDHKQMRHFFLPCWDDRRMICGTEPGTRIEGRDSSMDYTMIFPDKTGLAQVMGAFPEFKFTGTWDGHYSYARFTLERFRELGTYIYSIGGLLSHAHPMQLPGTGHWEDYFFSEQMALETVHADINAYSTKQNHALWVDLLNHGKRVRTHGSSDSHGPVSNRGLTTVYAEKHDSTEIFNRIRSGNCTAGGVGIRMSIDGCPMGGVTPFTEGMTLSVRVADFHPAHIKPDTVYCLKVFTEKGLAYAREFDGSAPISLVLPVQKRVFYRCEVTNESDDLPVAFSNPIWLD